MIVKTQNTKSIRSYIFSLSIVSLKLDPVQNAIRFGFKIGDESIMSDVFKQRENLESEGLNLEAEIIYDNVTKEFEPLRALIKVYFVKEKTEIAGVVEILLNDYLSTDSIALIHEKQLFQCPDWTAKIRFKITAEEIFQQTSPLLKRNINDFFSESIDQVDKKQYQVSILEQSIDHRNQHQNLESLNTFIQEIKKRNLFLQGQQLNHQRMIKRFQQKQNIFKRSLKQLQQSFQTLKQQLNTKEAAYQGLLHSISASNRPDLQQIQEFINCKKCTVLRGQIIEKQKNYEDQLTIIQGLLKQRDQQINKLHSKIQTLEKKNSFLKYKSKECQSYEILIKDVFDSLRDKAKQMNISIPELNLKDELLKIPQNLPSIFSNLLGRLQPHIGVVINGMQQQLLNEQKIKLWQDIRQKSGIISDLQFDLEKAIEKINQLESQSNAHRIERESILSMGTAKFGEISFGKKQSFSRRNSDLFDLVHRESYRVQQQIQFLKKRNKQLQQLLDQQQKLLESLTLQNAIKSKQLELRLDLQKRLQRAIQNQMDFQKLLQEKNSIIRNMQFTIQQHQQDVQQLKQKLAQQPVPDRKSRTKIVQTIIQGQNVEADIKDLLQSLDKDESSSQHSIHSEDKNNLVRKPNNNQWQQISPEIKSTLQKKIKCLSIEFLRMKSLKVSRCKSKEQTEQLMNDFINFRSKLQDAMNFVDNL